MGTVSHVFGLVVAGVVLAQSYLVSREPLMNHSISFVLHYNMALEFHNIVVTEATWRGTAERVFQAILQHSHRPAMYYEKKRPRG